MQCAHCLEQFHDNRIIHYIKDDPEGQWGIEVYTCANPECGKINLFLTNGKLAVA